VPSHHQPQLTAGQLCDLLNYILGLPVVLARRVARPGLEPSVLGCWNQRSRGQVELWCDYQMRIAGAMPRRSRGEIGRHPDFPVEARRLVTWFGVPKGSQL
jgi:hypothetical protein